MKTSTSVQIKEHQKYRRQSQRRIKPLLQILVIALALSAGILWQHRQSWILAAVVTGIPLMSAAIERWNSRRHQRALASLSQENSPQR